MKILISPAKNLNTEALDFKTEKTEILFRDKAWEIAKELKKYSPKDLSELMNISDKLAELNWQRNKNYKKNFDFDDAKPAIYLFNGDVYDGLDAKSLNDDELSFLQQNLRILSGQYGLLRPLDMIMPYRLEMGTKIKINGHNNLYKFWGDTLTESLNKELKGEKHIINLASNEYFKAINPKKLNADIITPQFMDYKNGKLKTISFFAKKARGYMLRHLAQNNITENKLELIKEFKTDGYLYDSAMSNEKNFIFTR